MRLLRGVATVLPVAIWSYLTFLRGGFWRVGQHLREASLTGGESPRVVAVIPARDEADVIGKAVESLLEQRSLPDLQVVVVDDNSSDGTAEAVRNRERVTVIHGKPLEPGWTGKLWALAQGLREAAQWTPDYFLLTDADIRHGEGEIARLIAIARAGGSDLASYMVKLRTDTPAERWLMPAFVYFFFQLYPPAWSASPRRETAGAAGGCILIRPDALRRAGGMEAIRGEVIDDCALARAVKRSGGRLYLGITETSGSLRSYGGARGVGRMVARSAFYQLRHSYVLLGMTLAGLGVTYVLPLMLLFSRRTLARVCGAGALGMMSATYAPTVKFYRRPLAEALLLPVVALFYAGATAYSAWQYTRGAGGQWKGRVQDVQARKRGRRRPKNLADRDRRSAN